MKFPLADIRVLVTRPAAQSENLCKLIEAAGGQAIRFPTMEIIGGNNMAKARSRLTRLADYQVLIFVSTNAVERGLKLINQLPEDIQVAAVGPATLRALEAQQVRVQITPRAPFNSEALLEHPALQDLSEKNILIVRGEGGRDYLAEQLRQRHGAVDYAEVYQRRIPDADATGIIADWRNGGIDLVTISSNQILSNLLTLLGPENHSLVKHTPLLGWGPRIMRITDTLNLDQPPLIATRADDQGVIETLIQWANHRRHTAT